MAFVETLKYYQLPKQNTLQYNLLITVKNILPLFEKK